MIQVTRREVLRAAGATAAAACAGGLLAGCQGMLPPPEVTSGTVNIGPASDYPAGAASMKFQVKYGIIIANDSGTRVALLSQCTHLGCTNLAWVDALRGYECPCHHSKFDLLGVPTAGPAKKPLAKVVCQREPDGTLTVDLTKLYSL
jgi:nitrite reductase/ring-hydroxylating ferredoxin subunit